MKRLLYWMLCLALLSGCGKDSVKDEPDEPENPVKPQNVTLELSLKDLVFEVDGGRKTFVISCNSEWTIENNSDWCRTDFSSGTGNLTVTVITESYDGMEDRNTNLTVKAGDKTQVLGVTQKYRDAIVLSKDKFEVPQEGKTISVEVKSNISYKVTIPEEFESWIAPAPSSRAVTTKSYDFTVSATDSTDVRSGFIVFSGNSLSDTVWVYQAQRDRLLLSQSYYSLSSTGGTFSVELQTNVDYDVIIPDTVSWVSRIETRALRTDKLSFSVSRNESRDDRSMYVRIKDRNSSLYSTLYIYQSGKGYLELSHKSFTVPQEGGNLAIAVESNTSYTVTIPLAFRSWITQLPSSRAVTTKEYNFNISANENFSSRNGYLIFTGNEVKDTVYVVQIQKSHLLLSQNSYDVSSAGGTLAVELKTNVDYEVEIPDTVSSWVSLAETRALRTDRLLFVVAANEDTDSRSAQIIIKDRDSYLDDTLYIRQSGKPVILLTQTKFDVPQEGSVISVEAQSNIDYEVTIPVKFASWISRIPESRALTSKTYRFSISANENTESRTGYVVFAGNAVKDTVYVYQMQKDHLELMQDRCTPHSGGEEISVSLRTNVDYRVEIPAASASWISLVGTRSLQTDVLCFHIESNAGGKVRTAEIVVKDVEGRLSDTLYVTQYGFPGDERDITADFDAGFAKVLQNEGYIPDATRIAWGDVRYVDKLSIGQKSLISLRGIKYFESLASLDCSYNNLTSLDVSGCMSLVSLDCSWNELTSLNVGENAVLTKLECNNNRLSVLNVGKNPVLTNLDCRYNLLTFLDVSENPSLTALKCAGNPGENGIFLLTVWLEEDNSFSVEEEWNYSGQAVVLRKQREASIGTGNTWGDVFTETVSGVELEMVYVKGGTFQMGGTSVTLSDYYIGKFEATQGLWQTVMGSNPSSFKKGDNYPVDDVTWNDIQAFLTKLNELTGKKYALPTEAQWEYAARGGVKSKGYEYSGSNTVDDVAWYEENSGSSTHLVGQKRPNELGIYDMSGNVMEWCQDWFGSYGAAVKFDPIGALPGSHRVLRGGSWYYYARDCRVSIRYYDSPSYRSSYYGFRVVLLP